MTPPIGSAIISHLSDEAWIGGVAIIRVVLLVCPTFCSTGGRGRESRGGRERGEEKMGERGGGEKGRREMRWEGKSVKYMCPQLDTLKN